MNWSWILCIYHVFMVTFTHRLSQSRPHRYNSIDYMNAMDMTDPEAFTYLLLYHYISAENGIRGCSFRKGWMDIMKSLLRIILWSKCKFKGVKARRKSLPTWLALMNRSRHLKQIPKWSIPSMWLRWLITLLSMCSFFKHLLQPQVITRSAFKTHDAACFKDVLWNRVWWFARAWGANT